jgi:hypothetical protein
VPGNRRRSGLRVAAALLAAPIQRQGGTRETS